MRGLQELAEREMRREFLFRVFYLFGLAASFWGGWVFRGLW